MNDILYSISLKYSDMQVTLWFYGSTELNSKNIIKKYIIFYCNIKSYIYEHIIAHTDLHAAPCEVQWSINIKYDSLRTHLWIFLKILNLI